VASRNSLPSQKAEIPKELDWDLWLELLPSKTMLKSWFHSTGAVGGLRNRSIGDMACHIIEPPFKVLGLGSPTEVECSVVVFM